MKTVLLLKTSLFNGNGQSSRLASEFVSRAFPGAQPIERDLALDPVPHLDGERFSAFVTPREKRTGEQQAIVAFSDTLIDELRRADAIVIGLPMYNFGVPSQLKAWIDHIARAGETFRYSDKGPVGLLTGKKAYIFATRGGLYAGTADTQSAYLRQLLEFVGIADIEFVYAEGLAISEAARNAGLAAARRKMETLLQ
ncbi:MAG: FMN-dependent NADH-azoreductase [Betaproteobacteria bacterium]